LIALLFCALGCVSVDGGAVEASWEPPNTLPRDDELREKFIWLAELVMAIEN